MVGVPFTRARAGHAPIGRQLGKVRLGSCMAVIHPSAANHPCLDGGEARERHGIPSVLCLRETEGTKGEGMTIGVHPSAKQGKTMAWWRAGWLRGPCVSSWATRVGGKKGKGLAGWLG